MDSSPSSEPRQEILVALDTGKEAIISGNPIIPFNLFHRLDDAGRQSVCKIQVAGGVGSGFLCNIPLSGNRILQGLLTNNHVLPGSAVSKPINVLFELLKINLCLTAKDIVYCFTCDLLDATFIVLKPDIISDLSSKGVKFLTVSLVSPAVKSQIYIVQHPLGRELALSAGNVEEYYGVDLRHAASTQPGSSGSPVLNLKLEVVAIHKGASQNKYNRATLMRYVVAAIEKDYPHFTVLPPRIPRPLYTADVNELTELIGMEVHDKRTFLVKIASGENVIPRTGIQLLNFFSSYPDRIWFRQTHHHWYWTPTDPSNEEVNWMQISADESKLVVGGVWDERQPSPRQCLTIDYFKRHGDFYCF